MSNAVSELRSKLLNVVGLFDPDSSADAIKMLQDIIFDIRNVDYIGDKDDEDDSSVDMVNHPPHYTNHPSGIECIDVIEEMPYNRGCIIKYAWRAGSKTDEVEDLQKCKWYIEREIGRVTKLLGTPKVLMSDSIDEGSQWIQDNYKTYFGACKTDYKPEIVEEGDFLSLVVYSDFSSSEFRERRAQFCDELLKQGYGNIYDRLGIFQRRATNKK